MTEPTFSGFNYDAPVGSWVNVPTKECTVCNASGVVIVKYADYAAWKDGMFAQEVFPLSRRWEA